MKFFAHYWPFVKGINRSPVEIHHKGPERQSFVSFAVTKYTVKQTVEFPVVRYAMTLIWLHCTVKSDQSSSSAVVMLYVILCDIGSCYIDYL